MTARPICKLCSQPLNGYYITALNATWHPEHFLCAACRQPIADASFNVHEGQPYHPRCYAERVAPRCAYCGKPLTGNFVESGGRSYHADCYREHVVPHCVYCSQPLMDEYLVNAWGDKYCKRHQQEYPACEFCGRLIPPSQQERGSRERQERARCSICRARAIETASQAMPLFDELKRWLSAQGLQLPAIPLRLELCDRATLHRYMQQRGARQGGEAIEPHMLGVTMSTTHTLDGREVRTDVDGIAVLRGLPTPLFQGVVAHELGHVWLITQGVQGLPQWTEEGFCELLAHRYYRLLNTAEGRYHAESIEKNPNPIYGDGFRRVRDVVYRVGFQQYVQQLRSTKRPPA